MTLTALLAWVLTLPAHVDGHHMPIPRPYGAALTIAKAALETDSPVVYAAMLDVLAPHESAYRTSAVGDGGKSCGAFQTPCGETPPDGLGQARLAAKILKRANDSCPGHPLWMYASGHCSPSAVALRYEAEVHAALQGPLPLDEVHDGS
jgi:hypothetical protein